MRALLLFALFPLAACGAASPTWAPAGYSYHNDEYKAQPGPEADTLGYDYTPAYNDHIVSMWSDVVKNLLNDLEAHTGLAPQTIHVEKLEHANAFNLSLDNALRDELRARGYILTGAAAGNVTLRYQAFQAGDQNKHVGIEYNGDPEELRKPWSPEKSRKFIFILTLERDGAAFGEIRRAEILPAYGYVAGEGNIVPAPRVMEGKGQ